MTKRREFLKTAGVATVGAVAASTLSAPAVLGQGTIKWRLQTYAGPSLAAHVIKPSIDAFNKVANGEMVIELFTADQLVPTGELDGIAWSGITEDYTVGWADVTNYFLTNNISGAWIGSYFANQERWDELPGHLQTLFRLCMDSSHYYRQYWYWGGEADLRVNGVKLELTSIDDDEWQTVEDEAHKFWEEIAKNSPRSARVVEIFKKYNAVMAKAGKPYRYS